MELSKRVKALKNTDTYNIVQIARILGLSAPMLYALVKNAGITLNETIFDTTITGCGAKRIAFLLDEQEEGEKIKKSSSKRFYTVGYYKNEKFAMAYDGKVEIAIREDLRAKLKDLTKTINGMFHAKEKIRYGVFLDIAIEEFYAKYKGNIDSLLEQSIKIKVHKTLEYRQVKLRDLMEDNLMEEKRKNLSRKKNG